MPADKHLWNLQYLHILFIDSHALQLPPSRHSWSSDACSLTLRAKNSLQSVHVKTSKETPDDNPLQTTDGNLQIHLHKLNHVQFLEKKCNLNNFNLFIYLFSNFKIQWEKCIFIHKSYLKMNNNVIIPLVEFWINEEVDLFVSLIFFEELN